MKALQIQHSLNLLGLRAGASREEVKKAYLRMAKIWHPDRFSNDSILRTLAEENLKEINLAYETLTAFGTTPSPEGNAGRTTIYDKIDARISSALNRSEVLGQRFLAALRLIVRFIAAARIPEKIGRRLRRKDRLTPAKPPHNSQRGGKRVRKPKTFREVFEEVARQQGEKK